MRIAILTFPNSTSLGASLQMYSLYKILEQMGHQVEILNYDPANLHYRLSKPKPSFVQKQGSALKQAVIHCLVPCSGPAFKAFEQQMAKMPAVPTSSTEELTELSKRYDRIFVGSDQVWNYDVTGHDFNFYLEFCPDNKKKVSYAASFGNDDVCENEKKKITGLLNEFAHISVREVRGQKIVKNLTGIDAKLVLDPTLAIDPDVLRATLVPYHSKEEYVLFYNIKPSANLLRIAQEFADRNGYILVHMGAPVKDKFDKGKHPVYGVGPKEFLGLIDRAAYVFTNSFHGVALSVALETNFYVEFSSDTNSRLINMVEILDLKQCVVDDGTAERAPITIDYTKVNEKLNELRKDSRNYIGSALGE